MRLLVALKPLVLRYCLISPFIFKESESIPVDKQTSEIFILIALSLASLRFVNTESFREHLVNISLKEMVVLCLQHNSTQWEESDLLF